jgi:F0F1-type ATP synthase membrane subunit b/b'
MKKLLTLLAGYAAGLTVAMKYRKDAGTSKLATKDPTKSKFDNFIDEVVDIHKSAFSDIQSAVTRMWDDVEDFDGLKAKVMELVESAGTEIEEKIATLRDAGNAKTEELLALADEKFAEKEATLEKAREKALTLSDVAHDTLSELLTEARKKLNTAHKKIKTKLEKESPSL